MENRPNAIAAAGDAAGANSVLPIRQDRRRARQAREDLQVVGTPQPNLLLVGTAGAFRMVLEMLWLELREPIVTCIPPAARAPVVWTRGDAGSS